MYSDVVEVRRKIQRLLILQGSELLRAFRNVSKEDQKWPWEFMTGEKRDMIESKVPAIARRRALFERWGYWTTDSSYFIKSVAGFRSSEDIEFTAVEHSTNHLLRAYGSPMADILRGVEKQIRILDQVSKHWTLVRVERKKPPAKPRKPAPPARKPIGKASRAGSARRGKV